MEKATLYYEKIKKAVENTIGRNMHTTKDFDYLAICIRERTNCNISAMTLKRFWGYLGKKNMRQPRLDTLNILAQTLGYTDWYSYCSCDSLYTKSQSDFILNNYLSSSTLEAGAELRIMWHPDRCLHIRYEGNNNFTIIESINSKLSANDTFTCSLILENEPLYLSNLIHEGGEPCHYVCGRIDGVKYLIIK